MDRKINLLAATLVTTGLVWGFGGANAVNAAETGNGSDGAGEHQESNDHAANATEPASLSEAQANLAAAQSSTAEARQEARQAAQDLEEAQTEAEETQTAMEEAENKLSQAQGEEAGQEAVVTEANKALQDAEDAKNNEADVAKLLADTDLEEPVSKRQQPRWRRKPKPLKKQNRAGSRRRAILETGSRPWRMRKARQQRQRPMRQKQRKNIRLLF